MKNYTYGWMIKDMGYAEVPVADYTESQLDMSNFIKSMCEVIGDARCGWDGVRYEVMKHNKNADTSEYMVLYCNNGGSRWIPIGGNSKGCNFSVLGENLW